MATHTVAAGEVGAHDKILVADAIDTVTFADDPASIEIITSGEAAIYVTLDGSDPTISGNHTFLIPAAPCVRELRHSRITGTVKLLSEGTPTYSVEGLS